MSETEAKQEQTKALPAELRDETGWLKKELDDIVVRMARRWCPEDAEEAAQRAREALWRKGHEYNPELGTPETFVKAYAFGPIRNYRNSKHNPSRAAGYTGQTAWLKISLDVTAEDGAEKLQEIADSNAASPEETARENELMAALRQVIAADTNENRRQCLLLDLKGYTSSEIAVLLEVNENTVKSYIKRGWERLAQDPRTEDFARVVQAYRARKENKSKSAPAKSPEKAGK